MLKAQINKTDRNDARGIAQMMRAGLYRPVHGVALNGEYGDSKPHLQFWLTAMRWPPHCSRSASSDTRAFVHLGTHARASEQCA